MKRTKHQREMYELAGEFFALLQHAEALRNAHDAYLPVHFYIRYLAMKVCVGAESGAREAIKLAEGGE